MKVAAKIASRLVLLASGALAVACIILFLIQDKVMYIPRIRGTQFLRDNVKGRRHPTEMGLPCVDLNITTSDGVRVHGWIIKQPRAERCATIFFLHGNSGNIGSRIPSALQWYSEFRCNIVQIDYRSFGNSEGVASEEGLIADVEAFLKADLGIDRNRVVLQGKSLGGAIAIACAARFPDLVNALIVENTFLSVPTLVSHIPLIGMLRKLWLKLSWNSADRAPLVTCPVLLVGGTGDVVTPYAHMEALFDLFTAAKWKRLLKIPGGSHNHSYKHSSYIPAVRLFLRDSVRVHPAQ